IGYPRFADSGIADHTDALSPAGTRTSPSFCKQSQFRITSSEGRQTPRAPQVPPRDDLVLADDLMTGSGHWNGGKIICREDGARDITRDRIVHSHRTGDRSSL